MSILGMGAPSPQPLSYGMGEGQGYGGRGTREFGGSVFAELSWRRRVELRVLELLNDVQLDDVGFVGRGMLGNDDRGVARCDRLPAPVVAHRLGATGGG